KQRRISPFSKVQMKHIAIALLSLACACASPAGGQNMRSQLGTVSQSVASLKIDIVYRRPVARGRALFGALVPWGRDWTPSADSAARVTLSEPIEVNGSRLARSEEHTSELQSLTNLVCRLLLEKTKTPAPP